MTRRVSRWWPWAAVGMLWAVGCAGERGADSASSAAAADSIRLASARGAADALGQDLMSMLGRTLEAEGPAGALAVCADSAQARTRTHQAAGVMVRRVGTRLRNPENAPDSLEALVLAAFGDALAAGMAPAETSFRAVADDGSTELRYLRPIRMQAMCLTCHGARDSLAAGIRGTLAQRYPADAATDYAVGELRGAISVRIPER